MDMEHTWAGGQRNEPYVAPGAPDASRIIWKFFNRHSLDGVDKRVNTPPNLSMEVEPFPATVGSTLTISARPRDPDGRVVSYEWSLDGTPQKGEKRVRIVPRTTEGIRVSVHVEDDGGSTAKQTRIIPVQSRDKSVD